jgi:glycerate 2-kinase
MSCPLFLVVPTSFKGSISAREAARAIGRGVRAAGADVVEQPLSDGGPGLIDALQQEHDRCGMHRVSGPSAGAVQARILHQQNSAIIESADACGLHLVADVERDPWHATTRGVGELIALAAETADEIVVGLGGSATVDGGIGMAAALGWRFLDAKGAPLTATAAQLHRIARLEAPPQALNRRVLALADVVAPLTGPLGAAHVFGPQKGVAREDVDRLDDGLHNLAEVIRRELGLALGALPGSGAAGGLAAGLVAFLDARLLPGSEWVLEHVDFDQTLARASLVITGEGSYDAQSSMGKITGTVIERARVQGVPVLLIAGRIGVDLPAHVRAAPAQTRALTLADLEHIAQVETRRLLVGMIGG